jgi:surface polysaccharide O-acyltransferase-like enzyme
MSDYLSKKIRVLSLLAIVMVVFVHAYNLTDRYLLPFTVVSDPLSFTSFTEYFVSNGLTRFAVPLFFAISGYLFFQRFEWTWQSYGGKLSKRLRTLLLPYLLWSGIGLFTIWAIQFTDAGKMAVDTWDVWTGGVSFSQILYRWLWSPVPFQLWFVRDLLYYSLLSGILYLFLAYLRFWPLLLVGLLWFFHANFVFIEAEGVLFFMCGAYLAIHKIRIPERVASWVPWTLLSVWLFTHRFR